MGMTNRRVGGVIRICGGNATNARGRGRGSRAPAQSPPPRHRGCRHATSRAPAVTSRSRNAASPASRVMALRECSAVARGHHEAIVLVAHETSGGGAHRIGGDHGQSLVHRLIHDEPPGLAKRAGGDRGQHEDVGGGIHPAQLGRRARGQGRAAHRLLRPPRRRQGSRGGRIPHRRGRARRRVPEGPIHARPSTTPQSPFPGRHDLTNKNFAAAVRGHAGSLGGRLRRCAPEVVVDGLRRDVHVPRPPRPDVGAHVGAVCHHGIGGAVEPSQWEVAEGVREAARMRPQRRPQDQRHSATARARPGGQPARAVRWSGR